jgi:hypothetical protein
MLAPGMSAAVDASGTYFAIVGVDPLSGSLAAALPAAANFSSANEGSVDNDLGLGIGTGTYGEFRVGPPNTLTYEFDIADRATWAENYTLLPGATAVSLYRLSENQDTPVLVNTILIPEPATITLLCLGGLLLRKKK